MDGTARRMVQRFVVGLGLAALAACANTGIAGGASADPALKTARVRAQARPAAPQDVVRAWPKRPRAMARAMIAKYGRPQQFDHDALVWFHNGPWKRTIVYRKAWLPSARAGERGCLQQTIGYLVPADKIDALRRFNPLIEVSQSAGELSFRSDSENRNYLALNLAEDIVTGNRSVAEARDMFVKTSRLAMSGKSSPYLDGLMFEVDNARIMAPTGGD